MHFFGTRAGLACMILAATLLVCPDADAESTRDFSAATNDGTLIVPEAGGGYDAKLKSDSQDLGREASASGIGPAGGGGNSAGKRDDDFGCSCDLQGHGGGGATVVLACLLLLARRRP